MVKHTSLSTAVCLALALPGAAFAEVEISGYLKNETSFFTRDGQVTNEARTMLDDREHSALDVRKFQNQARFFLNGDLGESSSWHADINFIYDTEPDREIWRGHQAYSAYDYLRELYLDSELGGWYVRLGKQQVVWGTADGIKLLDIINPTDFREINQDTMEDSRIPIWMLNVERDIGESGNIQLIVSQVAENIIPGLNSNGDSGHPFVMLGVDSITGGVNGFLNITPRLANVSSSFSNAAMGGLFTGSFNPAGLVPFTGLTVDGFASNPVFGYQCPPTGCDGTQDRVPFGPGDVVLNNITQNGLAPPGGFDPNGNQNVTNLMPIYGTNPQDVNWNPSNSTSAFEYMSNATFATFNTFAGNAQHGSAESVWYKDMPDDFDLNAGARYKGSTDGGLNFSFNYFYHYDANPAVDLSWRDAASNQELVTELRNPGTVLDPSTGAALPDGDLVAPQNAPSVIDPFGRNTATVLLRNPVTNQYYGARNPDLLGTLGSNGLSPNAAVLRFTEHYERIHSIGTSFDYAFDTAATPIVVRGEFLYDKDTRQPVVDKRLLALGDLANGLRTQEQDMFKYVLGAEVNVFTNLLVSGQFIQFINLDFKDTKRTCQTQAGNLFDCSRYNADPATLHLTNGMNKAEEYDTFGSLFLSKPFGPSQEHRVNNITIYEKGGGWWNRFDVEYTFLDELIGSFEWNQYWGDEDTTFGQFEKSSNLQVGLKYIF